jgi:2-keto-4-pentenoate hydratase/2-oxohepta-3-ene-1,7-dioic acid hydratase in catechol pathway
VEVVVQILRLGAAGAERPAVRADDGRVFDLAGLTADVDGGFLASDGVARAREALAAGALPEITEPIDWTGTGTGSGSGLRIGPPFARPQAVVCIGMNYAAHAAEAGAQPPDHPVLFLKHPNTVVGPFDDVRLPPGSTATDWEVELGVVIGRRCRYLDSPAAALDCVAGYVLSNDVSERDLQLKVSGGQWSKGKCAETFNPVGPWLLPADEAGDPQALALSSFVNGEPRQASSTADMIFGVAVLVHALSQVMVLEPGDLVNTGTPQGVALSGRFPYLAAGDVVELEITGLGRQRQHVR